VGKTHHVTGNPNQSEQKWNWVADSSNGEQIALNDQIAYVLERDNSRPFTHRAEDIVQSVLF